MTRALSIAKKLFLTALDKDMTYLQAWLVYWLGQALFSAVQ
jgi:hypothetical protein